MRRHIWWYGAGGLVLPLVSVGILLAADYADDREAVVALSDASKSADGHRPLKTLNGKWEVTYTWWLRPGYDPVEFKGRSVFQWVMDGRFMAEESQDQRLNTSYQRQCFIGYDNGTKEYQMVRMDVLGSDLRVSRGKADDSGKTITFRGSYVHPVTGDTVKTRTVLTLEKKNLGFEFFEAHGQGEESKSMEIRYQRRRRAGA